MKLTKSKYLAVAAVMALLSSQCMISNAASSGRYGFISADTVTMTVPEQSFSAEGIFATKGANIIAGYVRKDMDSLHNEYPTFTTAIGNGSKVSIEGGLVERGYEAQYLAQANNGVINLGYDAQGNQTTSQKIFNGDVVVGGKDTEGPASHSTINISLNTPASVWEGMAYNILEQNKSSRTGEINVFLSNGGVWDHSNEITGYIDGQSVQMVSRVNRLVGTTNRDYSSYLAQSDTYPIYINKLEGNTNFIFNHNANVDEDRRLRPDEITDGQQASHFWGGNIYVASAAPNSAVHVFTPSEGIDINDANKVSIALNNLANKVFYTGFVNGERNLMGTVGFFSEGANSALFKVVTDGAAKEGAITWQADKNGQGKYGPDTTPQPPVNPTQPTTPTQPTQPTTPVTPTNPTTPVTPQPQPEQPTTPVTPVQPTNPGNTNNNGNNANNNSNSGIQRGDYDTPHMRGARSAIMSNIGAWRTLTDDMYRTRALQQGAESGIWAHIGTGRYEFTNTGINNDSEYTRFQGGFDKKFGSLIVGGQIDYLRGSDDFNVLGASRTGSGKERAYAGGLYATKSFANNSYVQIEAKAGRVSNEFTVYNEISSGLSGKTSATGYSVSARAGKQVKFSNGLYVEPQAQLSYMHLGGDNFNAGSMNVNQSGVNSTAGKLGLEIGKTFGAGSIYTRFDVGHAFTGNVKTTYTSGSTVKTTETDIKGTWTDIAFGGRYGLGTNNSIYADVSRGLSGDYKQKWGITAGFSHKF